MDHIKKSDIYDSNLFDLEGFHMLEFENQIPFRWSEGIFKIVPKQKIKNLCLNFRSLNKERKIIIFLENKIKNIKHELILEKDNEYIIILTIQDVDCISFHISPNMKINNEKEIRTLGLYVKKIYTNDIDVNSIELLNSNNANYTPYLIDKYNIETKKFIESSLYEQNNSIKFLDLNYTRRNFEFNSSIFKVNDKKYLMTRNSQFVSQKMTLNSLKLYEYDTLKPINLNLKEEVDFEQFEDPTKTFLDPSCGDGQFLGEVLIRKMENGSTFEQALSTIYGVDLMQDNVDECRKRLLCGQIHLQHIVERNIVCHDALTYDYSFNGTNKNQQDLHLDQLFEFV